MEEDKRTTITLRRSTRDRLLALGDASESADDVAVKLIEFYERKGPRGATGRSAGSAAP